MTTKELSEATGRHPVTLAKWARQNVIPGVRVGGPVGWDFDLEQVQAALAQKRGNKAHRAMVREANT